MANNYFGFTPGGTQYAAQPAYAAPAAQPAAAYVQHAAPAAAYATATAGRPAYEAYQATPAGQYAYAARAQVGATVVAQPAAVAYDQTKTYAYAPAAPAAAYTVSTESYVTAKPSAYTAVSTYASQARQPTAQKAASTATYVYPATTTQASSTYAATNTNYVAAQTTNYSTYTGYDAALYSAATNYYQQQQKTGTATGGATATVPQHQGATAGTGGFQKKPFFHQKPRDKKIPPKTPQLHYCDVCKISCAGPQTYREHLEGQKHKKKEIAAKASQAPTTGSRGGQNQLKCELCDVACTGTDAYAAHIRGAKHQKVLKLHARLGKPIPSTEPTVITASGTTVKAGLKTVTKTVTSPQGVTKKVLATPKITFIAGTQSQLKTTGPAQPAPVTRPIGPVVPPAQPTPTLTAAETQEEDEKDDAMALLGEKEVAPVGHEYIEEVRTDGKVVSFNCKLCECKFNDPNAKEMHLKGRRHRLQYKKKVDPTLLVEVKPSIRARKVQEEKVRRQKDEFWRRRDNDCRNEEESYWEERRHFEEEMAFFDWQRRQSCGRGRFPPHMRRPETSDDRHVLAKHHSIYPSEVELQAVQEIVTTCEKALKAVSDFLADSDNPKPATPSTEVKTESVIKQEAQGSEVKQEIEEFNEDQDDLALPRALKGVMRVGVLAKGLLLQGDLNVHLVVLCTEKPTRTLLERIVDNLPKQLATVSDEKYDVRPCVEQAAIIVTSSQEPTATCAITLSSPVMREHNAPDGDTPVSDPPDVLDRVKCLEALAALRHAKWFQARANGLPSCVVVIRILRDLCQRVPTWTPLSEWAMELLVEKCISSGGPCSPGDALRRVFEAISCGIYLTGGPGLCDPCEKDPNDAAGSLTNQEREDITASAQIHKVLGMDVLPTPRYPARKFPTRKRRRTLSQGENGDPEGADGKKDKKEGETAASPPASSPATK